MNKLQYTGTNAYEVADFLGLAKGDMMVIPTGERRIVFGFVGGGEMIVNKGDWILRRDDGAVMVINPKSKLKAWNEHYQKWADKVEVTDEGEVIVYGYGEFGPNYGLKPKLVDLSFLEWELRLA